MLIDTVSKLEAVIPSLLACTDPAVDTETNGLDAFGNTTRDPHRIIGISIDDGREAYYFPFRHLQGTNLPLSCLEFFRSYLNNPNRTYEGFNYKFDQHMLAGDGVGYAPNYKDAMLAVHLLNENEPNFKLKDTCDRYHIGDGSLQESILHDRVFDGCKFRGIPCSDDQKSPHNWKSKMGVLDPSEVEPYACDDVRLTRALIDLVEPALQHYGLYDIWRQTNYYSYITALMEARGMLLDIPLIHQYAGESAAHSEDALKRLQVAAGYALNANSSKQVCAFLSNERWQVTSSAADALQDIIDAGGDTADRAKLIQEARGWLSVNNRYYTPYLNSADLNGSLHCNLNLIGTISGRLSCSNPNLQAVAKHTEVFKVKDVFIARPGYTLIQADYKQAEMRLVTYYTKDPVMTQLIADGADLHSATAETLGIPRNAAKRINFGIVYGIGKTSLSKNLRIPEKEAKGYLDKYHGLYPGFKKLMYGCQNTAEREGFIRMWTGRMRHFNTLDADAHKAMSNLIQGGVAEIVRVAISRLFPAVTDLGGYMLLQVHDSVMVEVPDEQVFRCMRAMKAIMEDFDFVPKVGVDIEYGKSWGTMTAWKGEVT